MSAETIIQRQTQMETLREPYEALKKLCIEMACPQRSDSMDVFGFQLDEGKGRGKKLYDATAVKGLDIWCNGILGHYMPKEVYWFMEQMPDKKLMESKRVRQWLQDNDDHLRYTINQSNYYEAKGESIRDSGCIGDSFMFIDEDNETGKQMFLVPHPREVWITRDFWGRLIEVHHKFNKSISAVKKEFGDSALSESQRLALEKSPDQPSTVIHAIYKNKNYDPRRLGYRFMRWSSFYVNVEAKIQMKEGGYNTQNPIDWSLNRSSHEIYGRGVVSQILIEILTANFIGKDMLVASQVAARPPMLITEALRHKLSLKGAALNFVGTREAAGMKMGDLATRLIDSSGYPFGVDMMQRWQTLIEERFGVPLFLALNMEKSVPERRTIYETQQKIAERAALLSPFLGTLGSTTDKELDRIYAIELEAGRAPEIPMEVFESMNRRIDIQYIGPLTQLLKQFYETSNLLTIIANIQQVLTILPNAIDIVEGDELMTKILHSNNTPEEIIRDKELVAQIREIAAQQQEQMMTTQLALEAAKVAPGLGKKTEAGSPLAQLAEVA